MILQGSNFPSTDYSAYVTFNGVEADSVEISLFFDVYVTATFNKGIPVTQQDEYFIPSLVFEHNTDFHLHNAYNADYTLTNPISVTDSTYGLVCSFAGGCSLEITASGLATNLLHKENNYISVCENVCVIDEELSTDDVTVCELPALKTTYSMSAYNLVEVGAIYGEEYFGSEGSEPEYAFNLENLDRNDDWNADCYFGTEFAAGYVGLLEEVKIYFGSLSKYYYADNLIFQGSNDGETYTDIFTVGKEIHEGWNYYDFEVDEMPAYRFYRFYGTESGSCTVNEVHLFGVEVIQDENSSYECTPIIH
jgi:hypothetical protein